MSFRSPRPGLRTTIGLTLALVLSAATCGKDSRNTGDSSPGATAVRPTSGASGNGGIGSGNTNDEGPLLSNVRVRMQPVVTLKAPTTLAGRPNSTDLFVTEQAGTVRRIEVEDDGTNNPSFSLVPDPTIDITAKVASGGERGLLGITFSPDANTLFLYYTALDGAITVDSFAMQGNTADPKTGTNLISIPHDRPNHNGGALITGPDGLLYIGTGDGGGGGDPDKNGQRTDTLLGRILRIDPTTTSGTKNYGIPASNPFAAGSNGAPEVFSYGLRNPWRISFDRGNGDLWIADVGQNEIEEINRVRASTGNGNGVNYGWNLMEGNSPFQGGVAPSNHTAPVFDYGHADENCSVTGGYVYRGKAIPALRGAYVFGDFCKSKIRGLVVSDNGSAAPEVRDLGIAVSANTLAAFGEDATGELYVLSLGGEISRILPG